MITYSVQILPGFDLESSLPISRNSLVDSNDHTRCQTAKQTRCNNIRGSTYYTMTVTRLTLISNPYNCKITTGLSHAKYC
jgi:hypothetical protein